MILSLSHRFIFVHVPKTAGSSVVAALDPYDRPATRTTWRSLTRGLHFVEPPETAYFSQHETARTIVRKLSQPVFDSFFSFAVVRNPFDHAVSHFEFLKQYKFQKVARKARKMSFEQFLDYRMNPPLSDRLDFRMKPPLRKAFLFAHLPNQSFFLVSDSGKTLVRRLIHFENLVPEFNQVVADIGLSGTALAHVNKTRNKSDTVPFQAYYNATTKAMVEAVYADDFERFGYSRDLPG